MEKRWLKTARTAECFDPDVIGTLAEPVKDLTGLAVVRGNLCENGAVIKPSASLKPELMQHRGRAVVFEDIDDYKARLDDPDLDVDENSILVLEKCRTERLSRYAGSRQYVSAQKAAGKRRYRHGADF